MATDPEQIRARITEIDAILQAGASSATVDGVTTSWDFAELRREKSELERQLPAGSARKKRRPMFYRNLLG